MIIESVWGSLWDTFGHSVTPLSPPHPRARVAVATRLARGAERPPSPPHHHPQAASRMLRPSVASRCASWAAAFLARGRRHHRHAEDVGGVPEVGGYVRLEKGKSWKRELL